VTFNEYQQAALRTANTAPDRTRQERLAHWALGLAGESGETAEMVKKHLFHDHELDHTAMVKELGDVLWYLAVLARELNVDLEEVALNNVEKLRRRYPHGFRTEDSLHRVDG
jgi:NTP pyrophosphatase (non-canonical NTP hydrolase)